MNIRTKFNMEQKVWGNYHVFDQSTGTIKTVTEARYIIGMMIEINPREKPVVVYITSKHPYREAVDLLNTRGEYEYDSFLYETEAEAELLNRAFGSGREK